jgi:AcrR family transcriptional regulator
MRDSSASSTPSAALSRHCPSKRSVTDRVHSDAVPWHDVRYNIAPSAHDGQDQIGGAIRSHTTDAGPGMSVVPEHGHRGSVHADAQRKRGRPRETDVDNRVLEATIDVLCDAGIAGVTYESLATRVGVARTTIYRRWPTKSELMVDAIDLLRSRSPVPDTGDTRSDLATGLENMLQAFVSPQGKAIAAVFAGSLHDDELAQVWREKIGEPHSALFREVLNHGVASGQVGLKLGVDETVAVVTGVAFLMLFGELAYRPGLAEGVVEMVLDGIARS